jgi:hypothetical protein
MLTAEGLPGAAVHDPVPDVGVLAASVAAVTLQIADQDLHGVVTACTTLMVTAFEYTAGQIAFCT